MSQHPVPVPAYHAAALVALYDRFNPWGPADAFYEGLAAGAPCRVLDIGSGTGTLACALAAQGHTVTGLDPSDTMLAVGRRKPAADRVHWHHGDAATLPTDTQYDLITLTGHAVQCLRTDTELAGLLAAVAEVLAPGGTFAFESRNPRRDWVAEWAGRVAHATTASGQAVSEHTAAERLAGGSIRVTQHYRLNDGTVLAHTDDLRFFGLAELELALAVAGLRIHTLYGDWQAGPFESAGSREMVLLVGHADGSQSISSAG
ncbi:MAG: methyltransferase domain-containing protein [Pseudomonadota bacterium]